MLAVAPPPPLAPHPMMVLLLTLGLLLLVARLLGLLAERLGLPAIVGELATGVFVGPSVLGHLAPGFLRWLIPAQAEQMHLVDAVGQLGMLLLVAVTGAHLDPGLLRRQGRQAAAVSLSGLLLPLALGIGLGFLLPAVLLPAGQSDRSVFALFIGVAMCVSAIPVIAKTLSDMGLLHRNVGQLTLASSVVDDAVGWILLSVVSAAATVGVHAGRISLTVLYLCGIVLLAATVGRVLVRRLLSLVTRTRQTGPTVATTVILVLLCAAGTQALGMEPVLGAFIAGILITSVPAAQVRLEPLRTVVLSVLAPLFLASAGLRMDLAVLLRPSVALAAAAVLAVAIAGKFAGAYFGARISGLSRWEGLALGAGMNARGGIEIIIALTGLRLGVIDTTGYTVIVLVAVVTSLMAPPVLRVAMKRVRYADDERLRGIDHENWRRGPVDDSPRGGARQAA